MGTIPGRLQGTGCPFFTALLMAFSFAAMPIPTTSDQPFNYTEVDRAWEKEVGAKAKMVATFSSSCVPDNMIIMTLTGYSNWYMMNLTHLKIWHSSCFFNRYLVITIDPEAKRLCDSSNYLKHCIPYHRRLQPSRYYGGDYKETIFTKIKAMKGVLQAGVTVFFIDSDVYFFKVPPFPPPELADNCDMAYQMENFDIVCELMSGVQGGLYEHRNTSCKIGPYVINGGQLILWPSGKTVKMLNLTIQCGLERGRVLSQDCMNGLVKPLRVRELALPSHFAGGCFANERGADRIKRSVFKGTYFKVQLTTFHAHCTGGIDKVKLINQVAEMCQTRVLDEW